MSAWFDTERLATYALPLDARCMVAAKTMHVHGGVHTYSRQS